MFLELVGLFLEEPEREVAEKQEFLLVRTWAGVVHVCCTPNFAWASAFRELDGVHRRAAPGSPFRIIREEAIQSDKVFVAELEGAQLDWSLLALSQSEVVDHDLVLGEDKSVGVVVKATHRFVTNGEALIGSKIEE